ncbi:hypothetical protein HDU83_004686 [Entophlyctis luteolus]|nr:hypothetical protein HDU82_005143 [Entophlyctis luteolus]KAJ3354771.1 hypothetical protein HDU83_004686 [Entophlyctis luteolus]KAJ3392958.1 hypothetical protein HDU84_003174 [Entophlyctis sp. JEL0112]
MVEASYEHDSKELPEGYVADLVFDEEEDAQVRRILDRRLMPWILFSTFILNMDRTNLSNAISANLNGDLGFGLDVINNANTLYAVVFTVAAFFGSIVGKQFGPHRVIPFLVFAWGWVTLGHMWIKNSTDYYLIRFLIAFTEGGVIPATLVYLGAFYKKREIATRLSWFWGVQSLASAFSGLMASGLLQLSGVDGLQGWRWLFMIDGIITIASAVVFWYVFPSNAYRTKGGLNFGGWFTERQSLIAVTRVINDDPLKLHYEATKVKLSDVVAALTDYKVWGHLVITCVGLTYSTPYGKYLPSIINSFGFNVYVSNALTAPNYILGFISMTLMTSHSDRVKERGLHGFFSVVWLFIGFALLAFLPDNTNKNVLYVVTLIISSAPLTHPLNISWLNENTAPLGKRTVASGLVIGAANIYGAYASQIYQAGDAPRYHVGNYIILGFLGVTLLLWLLQKALYVTVNKRRAAIWNAKTKEEKDHYEATTSDVGSSRLDFVFST